MTKKEVQAILDQFPDQVDTEQLMTELYLKAKLDRAEAAVASGDVVSHEEVVERSRQWSGWPVTPKGLRREWYRVRRHDISRGLIAMGRNLVYRPGTLIASILLAVLTLPSLLGAAEADRNTGVKGSETPQTLMATYRHALAAKDWRTGFCATTRKCEGISSAGCSSHLP